MSMTPPGDGSPPPPPPAQPPGAMPSYPVAAPYGAPAYPGAAPGWGMPGPAPGFVYASFWNRFGGYLIDSIITTLLLAVVAVPVVYIPLFQYFRAHPLVAGQSFAIPADLQGRFAIVGVVGAAFAALYFGGLVARYGCTVGQRAIGAHVVRAEDGGPLPAGRAFLRASLWWGPGILSLIPGIGTLAGIAAFVGFLAVAWDRQKQGWHDKLGRSLVVKRLA